MKQNKVDSGGPEVAVVGSGPTGLWLACELALAGVRVVILERLAEPTGRSKALGLQSRSMEMLANRGILDRFTAGNPAVPFLNFGMFPLDLRKLDFPHPRTVVIPQARVEALLAARAEELGVEIRRGHDVVAFVQEADGVSISVRTGSGDYEMTAQFLVGCDGGHSAVRKQLGVAFPGVDPTVVGHMGDVKLDAATLELLKKSVPELGGREIGIVRTGTGNFAIFPLESGIYRVAAVEWDRDLANRDYTMTLIDLQAAIRRVIGIDLPIQEVIWLSRATDTSRLVERYREGRVFLAGDAAHVHWAYGGKGLQTGMQDAGNLGWKLAAQVRGWAPSHLLDTYHSERHPIGERLITLSRAQEALARPGEHVTALRDLFSRLLAQEPVFRAIAEEVTDVDIHYDMGVESGNQHPLLGCWAPDLTLHTEHGRTSVTELMRSGKAVFIDLGEGSHPMDVIQGWADRVEMTVARCDQRPANLDAMLVRPDGYIAWTRKSDDESEETKKTLLAALEQWFGVKI
jgi:2-polyprenyl-6-methoxyphenol hydroxylase-like FAD-dependent oxidoreductase